MCRLLFVTKKRLFPSPTQRLPLTFALDKGSTFLFIKNMSLLIGACGLLTLCAAISLIVLGEKTSRTSTWSVVTLPLPGAIGAISFLSLLYASFLLPECGPLTHSLSSPVRTGDHGIFYPMARPPSLDKRLHKAITNHIRTYKCRSYRHRRKRHLRTIRSLTYQPSNTETFCPLSLIETLIYSTDDLCIHRQFIYLFQKD